MHTFYRRSHRLHTRSLASNLSALLNQNSKRGIMSMSHVTTDPTHHAGPHHATASLPWQPTTTSPPHTAHPWATARAVTTRCPSSAAACVTHRRTLHTPHWHTCPSTDTITTTSARRWRSSDASSSSKASDGDDDDEGADSGGGGGTTGEHVPANDEVVADDCMTEAEVKTQLEVGRLPLFPLDMVQFPGETTPLNVYEPRYQIMFESIMGNAAPTFEDELTCGLFGVVREKTPDEYDGAGETDWRSHNIGTVMQVRHSTRTDQGEMVFCKALHRIEILDVERNLFGYWVGQAVVKDPPMASEGLDADGLDMAVADAKDAYREFLKIDQLGMEPWEQGALSQILELQSTDWPRLTHWLAARLPVSSADKQSILESNDPIYRLLKLKVQYVKLALMFSGQQGSGAAGGGSGSDRPSS
eukprot:m.121139 g.121139  ORF g.121139 m.121139 type:complete len:416 (+) comp11075_c1_seq3:3777-5024(+)